MRHDAFGIDPRIVDVLGGIATDRLEQDADDLGLFLTEAWVREDDVLWERAGEGGSREAQRHLFPLG